jgi:hypothetical protein
MGLILSWSDLSDTITIGFTVIQDIGIIFLADGWVNGNMDDARLAEAISMIFHSGLLFEMVLPDALGQGHQSVTCESGLFNIIICAAITHIPFL